MILQQESQNIVDGEDERSKKKFGLVTTIEDSGLAFAVAFVFWFLWKLFPFLVGI